MKVLNILLLTFSITCIAQENVWTSFKNEEDYIGFKDNEGNIVLPATLSDLTLAYRIEKIAALIDKKGLAYYILRDGRQIGRDSVYLHKGYIPDCESEGYIKFSDTINEKVGMFDGQGNIAIPAQYSTLTPFRNGVSVALKDGSRIVENNKKTNYWGGGKKLLINKNNKILVENFESENEVDFYSLKILDYIPSDPTLDIYRGVNGKYYCFTNNKKIFKQYLNKLVKNITLKKLTENCSPTIILNGRIMGEEFVKKNYSELSSLLSKIAEQCAYDMEILREEDPYTMRIQASDYVDFSPNSPYFDSCKFLNTSKYPVIRIGIPGNTAYILYFFKTETGFKLINIKTNNNSLN